MSVDLIKRSLSFEKERHVGLIFFAGFLILLAVLLSNLEISELWAFGDLGIPPADFQQFYDRTFYIWQTEGIGSTRTPIFNVNVMMLTASAILGSTVAYKLVLISTFVIAYGSCYYLLRRLGLRAILCFLGATLYSLNPVTIAAFIGGEISEIMTFAIFPVLISVLARLFSEKQQAFKNIAVLALLTFAFVWNIYVAFWYGVLIAIPLLIAILIMMRRAGTSLGLKSIAIRASLATLVMVAIFLPTIVILQVKTPSASEQSFFTDALFTYRSMSLDNALRMAGNTGSAQENLGYNEFNTFTILGSIIAFVAIAPVILFRYQNLNSLQKLFLLSCSVSFVAIIAFLLLVRAYPNIVDFNLIFASLRNPKKLLFPLVFALTILFTLSTDRIISKVRHNWVLNTDRLISRLRHNWIQRFVIGGLFSMILLYNYPALDGTLGLEAVRGENYVVEERYSSIPSLLAQIDADYINYNIFVFPWQYDTNLKLRSTLPNYFGTNLGAGADGVNVDEFKRMFEIIGEDSSAKQNIFTLYNIKYVVIDKEFEHYPSVLINRVNAEKYVVYQDHDSYWATGDPNYLYEIMSNDSSFDLAHENEQFAIFAFKGITKPTTVSIARDSENIVANPSFESAKLENWIGWQHTSVSIDNQDVYAGSNSLAMQGHPDWWTNVHQLAQTEEYASYQLKFAFKAYNMTSAHVKLLWYSQDSGLQESDAIRTDYIRLYNMNLPEGKWNLVEETYVSPAGARFVDIQLLASRINSQYSSTLTLYDDVSFFYGSPVLSISPDNYVHPNPASWKLKIDSDGSTKVTMVQSYDPQWEAKVYKDGALVETLYPTKFFNVLTSFDVTTVGNDLELDISYPPQAAFGNSIIAVAAVLSLSSTYLLYGQIKDRRNRLPLHNMVVGLSEYHPFSKRREDGEKLDQSLLLAGEHQGAPIHQRPLVSVTIPTRNSSRTLGSCLEAVRNQTYPNVEIIVIDSESTDETVNIAKRYSAQVISTQWKLLGARYLGCQASKGEYVLLLDSDQILYPDTIERLVKEGERNDMVCLEEMPYNPESFLEKLFVADRQLINNFASMHLDPIYGVMLARFYRKSILESAFNKIPIDKLHDVVAHDHAIIYYETYQISSNVGLVSKAVMHKEPTSIAELWKKNYRYGKTTRELIDSNLYVDLLKKKTRFRKGSSLSIKSIQSFLLLLLKGVPYVVGLKM